MRQGRGHCSQPSGQRDLFVSGQRRCRRNDIAEFLLQRMAFDFSFVLEQFDHAIVQIAD